MKFKYSIPWVRFAFGNVLVNHPGFAVQLYFACNSSNQSDCRRRTYNGRSASNFIFNDWANGLEQDWMQRKIIKIPSSPHKTHLGIQLRKFRLTSGKIVKRWAKLVRPIWTLQIERFPMKKKHHHLFPFKSCLDVDLRFCIFFPTLFCSGLSIALLVALINVLVKMMKKLMPWLMIVLAVVDWSAHA